LVHEQASQQTGAIEPKRIFRQRPLVQKSLIAAPLLLFVLVFALVSPQSFAIAASRLSLLSDQRWPRRASLEMVGVDLPLVVASSQEQLDPDRLRFDDGVLKLPVGSSGVLRIRALADGAEVPSVCTVYYKTEDGTRGQSNMRRVGRERDGYQSFVLDGPPLSNLNESFEFNVLGLDDRLADFRIEAVEPPAMTKLDVQVRYPDYLRTGSATEGLEDGFDLETQYQAGLRISEGSAVTLKLHASLPVGSLDAVIESGGTEEPLRNAVFSEDHKTIELALENFRKPTAIRVVPSNRGGISAQSPFRYFLGAIIDEPPSVSLAIRGIQGAVTPIAMLPLSSRSDDDYAVVSLDAFIAGVPNAAETATAVQPEPAVDSGERTPRELMAAKMTPDRNGESELLLDLRELANDGEMEPLQPGDVIQVYAEARDGFDLDDGKHITRSQIIRLEVVTPEELLALLERRELGLRTRLEQTVTETQGLRDQLARFRTDGFSIDSSTEDDEAGQNRQLQILRLRVQQASLQVNKTTEELTGIAESLDDLLQEMDNNRIDSKDRQERLGSGVRDPLRRIVDASMVTLRDRVATIETSVSEPAAAVAKTDLALQAADQVLLELNAVLDKMLDLESYNEL
ncbi:MAG: polyketide synthase, partial [Planctomycetota bacterium]